MNGDRSVFTPVGFGWQIVRLGPLVARLVLEGDAVGAALFVQVDDVSIEHLASQQRGQPTSFRIDMRGGPDWPILEDLCMCAQLSHGRRRGISWHCET